MNGLWFGVGAGAVALLVGCGKGEPTAARAPATPPTLGGAATAPEEHGAAGHAHGSPHGGQVVAVGPYHLEAVASKAGLMLFVLDEKESTLPIDGITGSVLLRNGDGPPLEARFEPMGNHLHAMAVPEGRWAAAVTLVMQGRTLTARFEGGDPAAAAGGHDHGAAGGHDHGAAQGHDHGADGGHDHGAADGHDHGAADQHAGMPQMKLSETVDATLTAAGPIVAGQPAELTLSYAARAGGAALADFEVVHEQRLHVFVVKADMSFFDHVHPTARDAAPGTWAHTQVFPTPGEYRVYSDFKSTALGPNVTVTTVVVPGEAPAALPLTVDAAAPKTFGELQVTLTTEPAAIGVGDVMLRYRVADAAGQPVTDLEPYLGAFGHLFILHEDLVTMAHAHPRGAEPTAGARSGPEVAFHASLPKAGRYKLWAQFQRGGKIVTTDWTVEVR